MLQIMLFLIHTRYKYQKHKPDKYLINIQQSLNLDLPLYFQTPVIT